MHEIKIIIEVSGGAVVSIKASVPIQFVIVDYDKMNIGEYPLSIPQEPEAIGNPLYSLYNDSDNQQREIREELKRVKF